MLAGWLADRYGAVRVLVVYLLGCAVFSACVGLAPNVTAMFPAMFAMGSFASLYHPAGLALISKATTPRNRGVALGYHGVLGSIGIAGAPFLAGAMLTWLPWWQIYILLALPGLVLAAVFGSLLRSADAEDSTNAGQSSDAAKTVTADDSQDHWVPFLLLCVVSALYGFIYRGFLTFLPRYLSGIDVLGLTAGLPEESARNYLAAFVLAAGIIGQYISGHLASRFSLEKLMVIILLGNVPFLFQMKTAEGPTRLLATVAFALILFMWQPVSNCLIAKYTSTRRRSLGYGLSFFLSFGLGSAGAAWAGWVTDHYGLSALYPSLGGIGLVAAAFAVLIWFLGSNLDKERLSE